MQGIDKIQYKPYASPENTLCFKYYNEDEIVHGRSMKEWLRFTVCYWHTFRGTGTDPFGAGTITREWDDGTDSISNAERRLRHAFEFMTKLGVPFWTFHDRDIAPEGKTLQETNENLDKIVKLAADLQEQSGIKCLWATCNLFSHPRYMNGAGTNPSAHVLAFAGAQLKKGLEIALLLGAQNYVFWGGREGYQSLLNTDVRQELDNMACFFRMAIAYKKKIGFKGQFLIEPKAKEPTKHQYDYDAMTVIAFLKTYNLSDHFKINVEPNHTTLAGHCYEHDLKMASIYGMLGSIDANTGSPDLGWDTDQFPMNLRDSTTLLKILIEQGGIEPGGLNFDAKIRRESTNLTDLFIAHIGAMDTFARALRIASKIIEDGVIDKQVEERYKSFKEGIGLRLTNGECSLEECDAFIKVNGEPTLESAQQEHFETMFNRYL